MNSKERIIAALHNQSVDHIPFSPFLAYVWEFFPKEIQDAGQLAFHQMIGADPLWRGAPCAVKAIMPEGIERKNFEEDDRIVTEVTTPVGGFRFAYAKSHAGNTNFLVEHPLKCEEDFKVRMWIEEQIRYEPNYEAVEAHMQGNGKEGLSLGQMIPRCKSAYQDMVEFFVGTEELIYAQMDYPETVRALWETMVANDLKALQISVESPYDYFLSFEDSSTQNYSPSQYDEFIGSEIGQWCDALAGAGKYYVQHACGHVAALTERMRDHGVFAIESISPPPTGNLTIKDARSMIGESMGIIGGIEPTEFLNRDGDDLRSYAESVIDDAKGGPFVLANSDSCPPGVTVEKFKLVADVARNYKGWRNDNG